MSESTQHLTQAASAPSNKAAKLAMLRAPLQLLGKENASALARIKRRSEFLTPRTGPEWLVNEDAFLEHFDRIESYAKAPSLVLRAGLDPDLATVGLFGKSVMHSDTLWDALLATQTLMPLFQSWTDVRIGIKKGLCRVTFDTKDWQQPGQAENTQYLVALCVYLLRNCKAYRASGVQIYFPRANGSHDVLFPEADCVKSYSMGIVMFDETWLRSGMLNADPWLASVAAYALRATATGSEPDYVELVGSIQKASVQSFHDPMPLSDVSSLLDCPERTLQARLRAEGSTFGQIRSSVLHEFAKRELSSGRSIEETSSRLGFSHRQSFSEAFTNWEKRPPSQFQKAAPIRSQGTV